MHVLVCTALVGCAACFRSYTLGIYMVCDFGQEPNPVSSCAVALAHFQSSKHTYNVHRVQEHLNVCKWFVHLLAAMLWIGPCSKLMSSLHFLKDQFVQIFVFVEHASQLHGIVTWCKVTTRPIWAELIIKNAFMQICKKLLNCIDCVNANSFAVHRQRMSYD